MYAFVGLTTFFFAFMLFRKTGTNKVTTVSLPPIIPNIILPAVQAPAVVPGVAPSVVPGVASETKQQIVATKWNDCQQGMYVDDKTINGFCGEYQFLSNYYPAKVVRNGLTYGSAEAGYQASKFDSNPQIQKLFTSLSPDDSKTLSRSIPFDANTFYLVDKQIMQQLLISKFSDPSLNQKLKATGSKQLIEFNTWGDIYWGQCIVNGVLTGKNALGQILMTVRAL